MPKFSPKITRKIRHLIYYIFYIFLLLEISSRAFLTIKFNASFFKPSIILFNFYPELKDLKQQDLSKNNGKFDFLLLGGSVLHPKWGDIEELLLEAFIQNNYNDIRIHNLSRIAHTSLDSYYKYDQLKNKSFDLVLVYHGINEVRANNCPEKVFKNDYSHYKWYRLINQIKAHNEINLITFPYVCDLAYLQLKELIFPPAIVPGHAPRKDWIKYGTVIKTRKSFSSNLKKIITLSRNKHEPIILLTFAYYVPADYSLDRFNKKVLDYGQHLSPIEIWGTPQNVVKGIEAHNQVVRTLAQNFCTCFVDMEKLIPKEGKYFEDICHLTHAGSEKFVENVLPLVEKIYASYKHEASLKFPHTKI